MENFTHRVSLRKPEKPEPWTDPQTGEIYPNGKPVDPTEVYTSSAPLRDLRQDAAPAPKAPAPQAPPTNAACYCRNCGQGISAADRFCPKCGAGQFSEQPQQVVINNYNVNNITSNNIVPEGDPKNKWLALLLCLLFGYLGVHRFYEHKIGTGILWLFTGGLFGIGWLTDLIILLFKPTTYYVKNK